MRARVLLAALSALTLSAPLSVRAQPSKDPVPVLDRIAEHVREYYSRAQSLMSRETVEVNHMRHDFTREGPFTSYLYQLRLEWTPPEAGSTPQATMIRDLVTVNGRAPKPKDKPKCSQPKETWTEPLGMFFPEERGLYDFKWAGTGRMDGRPTVSLDFRERPGDDAGVVEPIWEQSGEEHCLSIQIAGRLRGRVWADADTGEVLRLDQSIAGLLDVRVPKNQQREWGTDTLTFERQDTSIRYKRVTFAEPEEAIMLPSSIQTMTFWRGGASLPQRKTQTFKDYRRFITGGRIVE